MAVCVVCIPDFQDVVKWGYMQMPVWRPALRSTGGVSWITNLCKDLNSSDNPLLHFRIQNKVEKKSVTTLTLAEIVKSLLQ